MQFTTFAFAAFAALASAAAIEKRAPLCGSSLDTPQCCETSVLGVASLSCAAPPDSPATVADFTAACAGQGRSAQCCLLPAAGLGVICQAP